MQEFGEFGCIQYSGSLDKTQVPFDLYVKVGALSCVRVSVVLRIVWSNRLLLESVSPPFRWLAANAFKTWSDLSFLVMFVLGVGAWYFCRLCLLLRVRRCLTLHPRLQLS